MPRPLFSFGLRCVSFGLHFFLCSASICFRSVLKHVRSAPVCSRSVPETFCSVRKPEKQKPGAKQKKTAADEKKRGADEKKRGGAGHLRKPIDGAGPLPVTIDIIWGGEENLIKKLLISDF